MPPSLLCHFLSVPKGGIVSKFDCTPKEFEKKVKKRSTLLYTTKHWNVYGDEVPEKQIFWS